MSTVERKRKEWKKCTLWVKCKTITNNGITAKEKHQKYLVLRKGDRLGHHL